MKKSCYGQWNCLIWCFELFFLVILSDFGVQCVIGFGRLWDFKRTNGNGCRGIICNVQQNRVAQFFRPMGLLDLLVWIGFLSFPLGLGPLFKGLRTNLKLSTNKIAWIQWCLDFRPLSKVALSILSELTAQCVVPTYRQGSCPFLMDFAFFFQQFCELEDLMITAKRT